MALEQLTPEQIVETNIPTGVPFAYVVDADGTVREKIERLDQVTIGS